MYNSTQNSLTEEDWIPQHEHEIEVSDWFEDAPTETECGDNVGPACTGVTESPNSVSCSHVVGDNVSDKQKLLENHWKQSDTKYKRLLVENQQLVAHLTGEKQKSYQLQKKVQYLQDNHDTFSRLKQTYVNMKSNDEGMMVEVKEQACQTWAGIICQYCIATNEMARELKLSQYTDGTMIPINKCDLANLQSTVLKLKKMIDHREKSWAFNAERERLYKNSISELQHENNFLTNVIKENHIQLSTAKSNTSIVKEENVFLKKIVIKLEKRYRDMERRMCKFSAHKSVALSVTEKDMVKQLIHKYSDKLKRKMLANNVASSDLSQYKVCSTIQEETQNDFTTSGDEFSSVL